MKRISVIMAAIAALVVLAVPAASQGAQAKKHSLALHSVPTSVVPQAPITPRGATLRAVGAAPINPVCKMTPAFTRYIKHHSKANASQLADQCGKLGKPLSRNIRNTVHKAATSACGIAGCDYIWLFNQGGTWAEAVYEAKLYPSYFGWWYGAWAGNWFVKTTGHFGSWTDSVHADCGYDCWYGYHYLSVSPASQSWMMVAGQGWGVTSNNVFVTIGQVITWNYIT